MSHAAHLPGALNETRKHGSSICSRLVCRTSLTSQGVQLRHTPLERTTMRQILLLVSFAAAVSARPNPVCSQAPQDPVGGAAANNPPTIVLDLVREAQAKVAAKDWKKAAALWDRVVQL